MTKTIVDIALLPTAYVVQGKVVFSDAFVTLLCNHLDP